MKHDGRSSLDMAVGDGISHRVAVAILFVLCVGYGSLRWLDLGTFWGDGPLWLFQTARAYAGELPYREFSLSYPPLSVWLFQGIYRLFGQTFASAQVLIDVLSTAVVLLTYAVAARVMPRLLALFAGIVCLCMGDTAFMLFSLQIATPGQLTGTIGMQLMTIGMLDRVRSGPMARGASILMTVGCAAGLLSKPEYWAGCVACLVAGCFVAICDYLRGLTPLKEIWGRACWPLLGIAIAVFVFYLVGLGVGAKWMIWGITGYGMARVACPWWPTGLGLFGALASLAEAGLVVALLSLLRFGHFARTYGRTFYALLAAAAAGALLCGLYVYNFISFSEANINYQRTASLLPFGIARLPKSFVYLFTKPNIFLPVMWTNVALSIFFGFRRLFYPARVLRIGNELLIVMIVASGLVFRQLFGDYAESFTTVTVAAYPFLYVLVIAFLCGAAKWLSNKAHDTDGKAFRATFAVAAAIVLLYAGLRVAIFAESELRGGYAPLQTVAGTVNLNDPASAAIYSYVRDYAGPNTRILDVGGTANYGGAINFALRRSSPVMSLIFTDIEPTDEMMESDVQRFRAAPPDLVIGTDPLESIYGLADAWNKCPIPSLVWAPHAANFDLNKHIPVIDIIRTNYRPIYKAGRWAVFASKQDFGPINGP